MRTVVPVELRGIRFGLRTLLWAMLSVSLVFGAYAWEGVLAALAALYVVGFTWWILMPAAERPVMITSLAALFLGLSFPCFCGPLFLSLSTERNARTFRAEQLKRVGVALRTYHDKFGCFPPAYTADSQGQPLCSWRVLVQPYVDTDGYDYGFDTSRPWNWGHNPGKTPCSDFQTSGDRYDVGIFAVTGSSTAFPGAESRSLSDIRDDPAKTILLIESVAPGRFWSEPYDLELDKMSLQVGDPGSVVARHWNLRTGRQGAFVLFADGHVEQLSPLTDPERLKSMLRISDGKP